MYFHLQHTQVKIPKHVYHTVNQFITKHSGCYTIQQLYTPTLRKEMFARGPNLYDLPI